MKGLKEQLALDQAPPKVVEKPTKISHRPPSREGKRALVGHFSPQMTMKVAILARTQERSIQSLMGEALDELLVKYGERPFGER